MYHRLRGLTDLAGEKVLPIASITERHTGLKQFYEVRYWCRFRIRNWTKSQERLLFSIKIQILSKANTWNFLKHFVQQTAQNSNSINFCMIFTQRNDHEDAETLAPSKTSWVAHSDIKTKIRSKCLLHLLHWLWKNLIKWNSDKYHSIMKKLKSSFI